MKKLNNVTNILNQESARNWIHFAQSHGKYLFTIQEDDVLTIWNTEAFKLEKITEVSLGGRFYTPDFQFQEDKLLLWYKTKMVIIDFSNIGDPKRIFHEENDRFTCCSLTKEKLYKQIRISMNNVYKVSAIPTSADPNPPSKLDIPISGMGDSANRTLITGDTIYWINQDCIVIMDISEPDNPKITDRKEVVDLTLGHPILLPGDRMAIIETFDNNRIGCNVFDISRKNLKKIGRGLLKKHCIRGFCLVEETLYIAHLEDKKIGKERRYKTYLSKIDFSDTPIIEYMEELPFIEAHNEDSSKIRWLGVDDNQLAILLGNGEIHRFDLKK